MDSLDLKIFNFLFQESGYTSAGKFIVIFIAEYLPYLIIASVVIALLLSLKNKQRDAAILYFLALVSAFVARGLASAIRFFYHHPRPPDAQGITPLFTETSYSFPSGHTIFFFALATGVYCVNKKFGIVLFILGALIGFSRILAGVHWPSDILGGIILGVLVALIIFWIGKSFQTKTPTSF